MKYYHLLSILFLLTGCDSDFLEKKPNKALLVPQTLGDFQALLDNHSFMNIAPNLPLISSDDVYITEQGLQSLSVQERNSYFWSKDIYENSVVGDWNIPYRTILYTNIVLEGLGKLADSEQKKEIEGSALFFRAWSHANLVQQFAPPYDPAKADLLPGIPVKLESDVNLLSFRASLANTYGKIISDLKTATVLLADRAISPTRPTKNAAYALLARVYLIMHDYENAEHYASMALKVNDELLDYNLLSANLSLQNRPFPALYTVGNSEVIFYVAMASSAFLNATTTAADTSLFNLYDSLDLRRELFYVRRPNGTINFKGSYSGQTPVTNFSGLANDEVYLIAAECQARRNALNEAEVTMSRLLEKRWKKGVFNNITFTDRVTALHVILQERRKQLAFRGTRWADLRRLNQDPVFSKALVRNVNGDIVELIANDVKYTFPIPEIEVRLNGMEQNPR